MTEPRTVAVIDDDQSMREALQGLLETAALNVELYASPREYLSARHQDHPNCIVLDVRLPESSGLDFQRDLAAAGIHVPIIFITGYADVPMTVRAMKAGAVDFLTKPFRHQELLEAVLAAIETDRTRRTAAVELAEVRQRFDTLSPRERQMMALVASGQQVKKIAGELAIREVTVRVHRREIMRKLQAKSVADLVRMADALREAGVQFGDLPGS